MQLLPQGILQGLSTSRQILQLPLPVLITFSFPFLLFFSPALDTPPLTSVPAMLYSDINRFTRTEEKYTGKGNPGLSSLCKSKDKVQWRQSLFCLRPKIDRLRLSSSKQNLFRKLVQTVEPWVDIA
jgi:hypothetical protein